MIELIWDEEGRGSGTSVSGASLGVTVADRLTVRADVHQVTNAASARE
jgi:hypothetical protein